MIMHRIQLAPQITNIITVSIIEQSILIFKFSCKIWVVELLQMFLLVIKKINQKRLIWFALRKILNLRKKWESKLCNSKRSLFRVQEQKIMEVRWYWWEDRNFREVSLNPNKKVSNLIFKKKDQLFLTQGIVNRNYSLEEEVMGKVVVKFKISKLPKEIPLPNQKFQSGTTPTKHKETQLICKDTRLHSVGAVSITSIWL